MTKEHRTIVALLAAVAVLLGLNLFSDREAEAQVETGITGSCCLPTGACARPCGRREPVESLQRRPVR